MIRDPIEYEVREVLGPGKPGELYVKGERANRRFFYEAPPPLATLRPSDIVGFDSMACPSPTASSASRYRQPPQSIRCYGMGTAT